MTLTMDANSTKKRAEGRYYTVGNPFACKVFEDWAMRAGIADKTILEPFAGCNSLIDRLEEIELCDQWKAFDILPCAKGVRRRDTLASFPEGFDICVTNPPWLAKNSATARGLPFPECRHDDLYKFALEKCLDHCAWVAALLPESFIRANLFHERLTSFISLRSSMFRDTNHPVGLALFEPDTSTDVTVWSERERIGTLTELQAHLPQVKTQTQQEILRTIRFNDPNGNLGLVALDNTRAPSIRFCDPKELDGYSITHSSRALTKIHVPFTPRIRDYNAFLDEFRARTRDVLLTCYRGLRRDGMYRRRLDWKLARSIVCHVT